MSAAVKSVYSPEAESFDLVTKLRMCNHCVAGYRLLSPVERIEQLTRLREEALVEMRRIAQDMLTDG